MEIALTGFNPQASIASAETARQRQNSQQREQPAASERRVSQEQASQSASQANQNRAQAAQRTPESARVINGEVLSSETSRVDARDSSYSFLSRNSANQQSTFSQPDTRRVSVEQAMQNFQQNEEIVSSNQNPRQVSGIIDEYV